MRTNSNPWNFLFFALRCEARSKKNERLGASMVHKFC